MELRELPGAPLQRPVARPEIGWQCELADVVQERPEADLVEHLPLDAEAARLRDGEGRDVERVEEERLVTRLDRRQQQHRAGRGGEPLHDAPDQLVEVLEARRGDRRAASRRSAAAAVDVLLGGRGTVAGATAGAVTEHDAADHQMRARRRLGRTDEEVEECAGTSAASTPRASVRRCTPSRPISRTNGLAGRRCASAAAGRRRSRPGR